MRCTALVRFAVVAASLPCVSCGGGGGGKTPVTVTITSTGGLDGFATSNGSVASDSQGGVVVGDAGAVGFRGFVSFELSGVSAGATIQSATLKVIQNVVAGAPYATLGDVFVDQVVYGTVFEAGAYNRSFPSNQGLGPISVDQLLGQKTLDVRAAVQTSVDRQDAQCQFRLRFSVESNQDGVSDQALFGGGSPQALANDQATLTITYLH